MSEQERAEAVARVTLRQCDIDRLKKRLARARRQRDEWRAKAEHAEWLISRSVSDYTNAQHKRTNEANRNEIWKLEAKVRELKEIIADKFIERAANGGSVRT